MSVTAAVLLLVLFLVVCFLIAVVVSMVFHVGVGIFNLGRKTAKHNPWVRR